MCFAPDTKNNLLHFKKQRYIGIFMSERERERGRESEREREREREIKEKEEERDRKKCWRLYF
jgi:hypothetical protein